MWSKRTLILVSAIIITPILLLSAIFSGLVWKLIPVEENRLRYAEFIESTPNSLPNLSFAHEARRYNEYKAQPLLSSNDIERYKQIAIFEQSSAWKRSNSLIKKLDNPLLVGHVLAERYLGNDYITSGSELKNWLKKYPDHPQISRIEKLAMSKRAIKTGAPKHSIKRICFTGDKQSNQRFRNKQWRAGLSSFEKGNYEKAYKYFSNLTTKQSKNHESWDQAAIHFWAFRAASANHQKDLAQRHLISAAHANRSFYGILAQHRLNQNLHLVRTPKKLDTQQVQSLYNIPAVRRMLALAETGNEQLIEAEIHHLFPILSHEMKSQLLSFIMPLSLPATQIRMGLALELRGDQSLDYAVFPMPNWQPEDGYTVDPALLMAIARQESGFNPVARSYAGAKGLMQIMPATARYIVEKHSKKSNLGTSSYDLSDPIQSITLGQRYIQYLMQKDYVGQNLVYMAIAYNAGPGNLIRWQKKLRNINDPLLFIERIPALETRNYVQSVLRNYWIYKSLSESEDYIPNTTKALLTGKWPKYPSPYQQIAQIIE